MQGVLSALLFLFNPQLPEISRDAFGVPHIKAPTVERAFFEAGFAVAQDRMWQMEQSRRLARGKMAEVFGPGFVNSDKEVLQTGYTEQELQEQFEKLSPISKTALSEYAKGVNAYIGTSPKLPQEVKLAPWTELDSVAIAIRLFQQFGRGGAGEIRNMALLGYLQGRLNLQGKVTDVLDDFIWWSDPDSPTTVRPEDDPIRGNQPGFYRPSRSATEKHIALLPKLSLLELLPAIRMAERSESTRMAEQVGAPFKSGSYAVVVGPSRSASGAPILLSAPQMGFRQPSIVHEMSIEAPGLSTVGMDVPGVPGIVIGYTPKFAWGLTSGVADTDDIFFYKTDGADGYLFGAERKTLQVLTQILKVKGSEDVTVTQTRTEDGPVILKSNSAGVLFAKKASYWGREMESYDAVTELWGAESSDGIERALESATMSFNFFYASTSGDIGYRYVGLVPVRATGVDPRFPTPAESDWNGYVPSSRMPRVRNPRTGLIANWNNKPSTWWPNFDTPVWGRVFRNSTLLAALDEPKLSVADVELAAWQIARYDETWAYFGPFVEKASKSLPEGHPIRGFDGWLLDGSRGAAAYTRFLDLLRSEIFLSTTGNFLTPDTFRLAAQPSVMLQALNRKTRVNYLGARSAHEVVSAAMAKLPKEDLTAFKAPGIIYPGHPAVPYSNRGSYIQIVELLKSPVGRNVLPPGVAESGEHAWDQIPLARAWTYKPMSFRE